MITLFLRYCDIVNFSNITLQDYSNKNYWWRMRLGKAIQTKILTGTFYNLLYLHNSAFLWRRIINNGQILHNVLFYQVYLLFQNENRDFGALMSDIDREWGCLEGRGAPKILYIFILKYKILILQRLPKSWNLY